MRMPGASSGLPMNWMPAASSEAFKANRVLLRALGIPVSASMLAMVRSDKPECSASSDADQPNAALPALICSDVIIRSIQFAYLMQIGYIKCA